MVLSHPNVDWFKVLKNTKVQTVEKYLLTWFNFENL